VIGDGGTRTPAHVLARTTVQQIQLVLYRHQITVAVGTTITGRPPHRSVQARLRIRLLPWMGSGEACIRVGMQNAGLRNPPCQQRGETIPPHLCPLTATYENAPPQPANASAEDAQLGRVTWNGIVHSWFMLSKENTTHYPSSAPSGASDRHPCSPSIRRQVAQRSGIDSSQRSIASRSDLARWQ
jgi:hypothetical protein